MYDDKRLDYLFIHKPGGQTGHSSYHDTSKQLYHDEKSVSKQTNQIYDLRRLFQNCQSLASTAKFYEQPT